MSAANINLLNRILSFPPPLCLHATLRLEAGNFRFLVPGGRLHADPIGRAIV
jgi:hypothetical protein